MIDTNASICDTGAMGRPAQIDRDAVLRASLEVADKRGLEAVTMQAVADRLGVTSMALYRHVDNKADLLDGVVEQLLTEFALPETNLGPADRLAAIGRAVRATARRHPTVFPLLLRLPAATPGARQTRSAVYEALAEAGIAEDRIERTERLVSTMVLGFAASEASGRFAAHPQVEIDRDYEALEAVIRTWLTTEAGGRIGI